ncbi:F0F1 ATP synthase subunit epsilon [Spiroplasma sabaudiense Ar-1343]|uniref:F0F1 ATP synthase subunit epsilon n=1 Tax=Spiroplasma sabaudiense Ar-1343 TaxID=1276257 RepID=W6A8X5_9MOLU|nr:F0F1 ATP synthase subunit epsilon [Spiroplasma sabaudiense]AHI53467.1 F0F1 ATP synthase subunit epsilon [Spiroplasma sabaudiense Ar-1343]
MTTKLKIITPEGIYLNDILVDIVNVQTTDGDLGILANHIPLVATLRIGTLNYRQDNKVKYVHVHRGILKVSKGQVRIITERLYPVDSKGIKIK